MDITLHRYKKFQNYVVQFWNIKVVEHKITITTYYGDDFKKIIRNYEYFSKNNKQVIDIANGMISKIKKLYNYLELNENIIVPKFELMCHNYSNKKETWVNNGCYIQPKMDSVKCVCLYDKDLNEWKFFSRTYKEYFLPNIKNVICKNFDENLILEGELIINFDDAHKLCRLNFYFKSEEQQKNIKYIISDIIDNTLNTTERLNILDRYKYLNCNDSYINIMPTQYVNSWTQIEECNRMFTNKGYIGALIKYADLYYTPGYPKKYIKINNLITDEFIIISYYDGIWKGSLKTIWNCITSTGGTFKCSFKNSKLYEDKDLYINKYLIVGHYGLTSNDIPKNPQALYFKEDL